MFAGWLPGVSKASKLVARAVTDRAGQNRCRQAAQLCGPAAPCQNLHRRATCYLRAVKTLRTRLHMLTKRLRCWRPLHRVA
eukprot:380948-Alexandrium_andersonii.AAC.1